MIHLSLYLRCEHCPERWMVNSDEWEEYDFQATMARIDWLCHRSIHLINNTNTILRSMQHDITQY